MIYLTLKRIFRYAIQQYFSTIEVRGKENIPLNKPLLILPNHRSAFMDPIVVATLLKPEMHFLARGESFNNNFMSRIFASLNMIPIYRRSYSPDEVHKNEDVFRHCFALLEKKGALMIYPEGLCQTQFVLEPLKSGSARIALGAEAKNDFNLDVQLIPIGINYTHPHMFRSGVVVDIGKAIPISRYKPLYQEDPQKAIDRVTADLETEMKSLTIILDDVADTNLMRHTEVLLAHEPEAFEIQSKQQWYDFRKLVARGINYFRAHQKENLQLYAERLKSYVHRAGLVDPASVEPNDVFDDLKIKNKELKLLVLILSLPVFFIGVVTHGLPFLLTKSIAQSTIKRSDFTGSVYLALGLLMFAVFGIVETYVLFKLTHWGFAALFFFLIWPTLGLFTYGYFEMGRQYFRNLKAQMIIRKHTQLNLDLQRERKSIINVLKKAYLTYGSNNDA